MGRAQPISPGIQIQSQVDCFGLGAHVCAAVVFLVVQLIWIGRIDVDRIPSTTPGAEPPRDAKDSGSARSHSTHLETSSSNRP